MDLFQIMLGISFIILIGFISEALFYRTHIPDVLILFLLGILIGPVLHYISPSYFSDAEPLFITLTLIILLFEGGLNIKFHDLLKGAYVSTALSVLFFMASAFIVAAVMFFFGYPPILSLLLGAILGGTSSALVIPMVKLLKLDNNTTIILTLESALTDVLCIVGVLTIIEIMRIKSVVVSDIIFNLLAVFLIAIFIGIVSGVIWFFLKDKFPKIDHSYMTTIAVLILIYVCTETIHSNGAIAVLSFGIVLGNSKKLFAFLTNNDGEFELAQSEKTFYSEITSFVKVFFFVYLGVIMDFSNLYLLIYGAIITIFMAGVRPFIVKLSTIRSPNITQKDKIMMSIMFPIGLTAAILTQIALQSPVIKAFPQAKDISAVTLSVILFSVILTSFFVFIYEKKFKVIEDEAQKDPKKENHILKKPAQKST